MAEDGTGNPAATHDYIELAEKQTKPKPEGRKINHESTKERKHEKDQRESEPDGSLVRASCFRFFRVFVIVSGL